MTTTATPQAARGALFDLDGVIIDSESQYTRFWEQTARQYGIENPHAYALEIKGTALQKILLRYDPSVRQQIVDALHAFEQTMYYPLYDGVIEFLSQLEQNGIPAALVTSSDAEKMQIVFRQHPSLRKHLKAVVTGSDVSHSKPHPEGYLKGAEMIGVNPKDCLVFEDSLQGLRAGRSSGAQVIALTTSNPREKVSAYADRVIDSFREISVPARG